MLQYNLHVRKDYTNMSQVLAIWLTIKTAVCLSLVIDRSIRPPRDLYEWLANWA